MGRRNDVDASLLCFGGEPGKVCKRCNSLKPISSFGKNKARTDGVQVYCKPCTKEYFSNKEYDKARWSAFREQESARNKKYREENADSLKEKWRERQRVFRKENPAVKRKYNIARKHGQVLATPSWADVIAINAIYQYAKQLESVDSIKRHVDHVIPLKHPLVCGLHVHNNLRVVSAKENMAKHNRFEVCDV